MITYNESLKLIKQAIDLPENFFISYDTKISSIPGWDSFKWIAVIHLLEKETNVTFCLDNMEDIVIIGQLLARFNIPCPEQEG